MANTNNPTQNNQQQTGRYNQQPTEANRDLNKKPAQKQQPNSQIDDEDDGVA